MKALSLPARGVVCAAALGLALAGGAALAPQAMAAPLPASAVASTALPTATDYVGGYTMTGFTFDDSVYTKDEMALLGEQIANSAMGMDLYLAKDGTYMAALSVSLEGFTWVEEVDGTWTLDPSDGTVLLESDSFPSMIATLDSGVLYTIDETGTIYSFDPSDAVTPESIAASATAMGMTYVTDPVDLMSYHWVVTSISASASTDPLEDTLSVEASDALSGLTMSESGAIELSEDLMISMQQFGFVITLDFNKDGTGAIDIMGEKEGFTWTATTDGVLTIVADSDASSTLAGVMAEDGQLILASDDGTAALTLRAVEPAEYDAFMAEHALDLSEFTQFDGMAAFSSAQDAVMSSSMGKADSAASAKV